MQRSYIEYAMSVIVSRALPDVRDGLKPVHRRIIYAMWDGGYRPDRGFNKCSRVVGDVMGQYHPHGDSGDLRRPRATRPGLVDALSAGPGAGQLRLPGNDGAAAPRYTECRMAPLSVEMVRDIDQDTVDFGPNYDGKTRSRSVLPARFPNLLVNGSAGHRRRHGHPDPAAQPDARSPTAAQWVLEHPDATREETLAAVMERSRAPTSRPAP
jgi:DNA gyrase subunit A